jgi:hypothetical protein
LLAAAHHFPRAIYNAAQEDHGHQLKAALLMTLSIDK